ncbi:MAG: hypothetical protein DMG90_05170 [Acidobacteria bacterium]|nr:MAG: hypothetical protein DMG90_05170 [Acidobacteriota bacterium]
MTTKRDRVLSVLLLPFLSSFGAPRSWAQAISGFTPASAAHEEQIEQQFKSIPNPDEERRQHRIFTAEPHVAGSQRNNHLANYIAEVNKVSKMSSFGATTFTAQRRRVLF